MTDRLATLRKLVRDVPDFPKPGVVFKDITPLLADAKAFATAIDALAEPYRAAPPDKVVGIEARGFIFSAPLAHALGAGFVPARKAGKLPWDKHGASYELEYGSERLELHADAVAPGERVLLVDDVIATGGTIVAAAELIRALGGEVIGVAVVIELAFLAGRDKLGHLELFSLLTY